jgi:hypothetical protein
VLRGAILAAALLALNTWIVGNQGLAAAAGMPIRSHVMAIHDILRHNHDDISKVLRESTLTAIRQRKFDVIVVPGKNRVTAWFWDDLVNHYRPDKQVRGPDMLTGWNIHLVQIWRAKGPSQL